MMTHRETFTEVLAPGTCGELIQGTCEGVDFLVTCPIARFVRARVRRVSAREGVTVQFRRPVGRKVQRAVEAVVQRMQPPGPMHVELELDGRLPRGKGLASSTAEIVAVVAALLGAYGRRATPLLLARIAAGIEPSDGLMFPGIVAFAHRRGRLLQAFGPPPDLDVFIFDTGGRVDTIAFNRRADLARLNAAKEPEVREALALLREGMRRRDAAAVAQAATLSAFAHQRILPKPGLETLPQHLSATGGLGLCVAHSGTVVGLLYPAGAGADPTLIRYLRRHVAARWLGATRLIGGGVRYVTHGVRPAGPRR